MLTVFPAIDLRKGNVVRLYKGLYNKETIYSENPLEVAGQWKDKGAQILHIIDLDGAYYGELKNIGIIKKIIDECGLNVHLGGGIRSEEAIKKAVDAGVHKVIMSTKIFQDRNFLSGIKSALRDKIIVSIDSKAGIVLDKGWTAQTSLSVKEALKIVEGEGIKTCVVTDVSQDGTLMGPNVDLLKEILISTKMEIISAGGISSADDIKILRELQRRYVNLYGVIIGKALYEGKINLKEAIDCAK